MRPASRAFSRSISRLLYYGALLLLLPPARSAAQDEPGAASPPLLETAFRRDVNRFRWEANLNHRQRVARWTLRARNRFTSDAFILFENRLSFRDENHFDWSAERPFGDRLGLVMRGQVAAFSLSRVLNHTAHAGLRYAPTPYAWFEPALGVAVDRRPGVALEAGTAPLRADAGPAYGGRFLLTPPSVNGYRVRLQGDASWQVITPRRGRAVQVLGHAERLFEDTRLATDVQFSSFRRDAYQAVSFLNRDTPSDRLSETVEATTSDTLAAALELDAPLFNHLRLISRLDFSANNRLIRTLRAPDETLFFDTDFNRRAFDLDLGFQYERPRLTTRVALRGGAEVERRSLANDDALPPSQAAQKSTLLKQADYDRGLFMLLLNSRAFLSRRVVAVFDGSASILRHDTPETNADDRDEVYYNGQFGIEVTLSRYLQADLKLFGTYYHTVYLKATRSAENNVQRSLRLRPTVRWTPSERTRIQVSSEVRATYTVDDFVLPGRRPTDQSAREMRYDASLEQDLGRGRRLRADGSLSDLRLGRFLDNVFAEIPFDTLRTYSGWVRLQAGRRVTAEVGLRFLIRSDFNRATAVRYPRIDEEGAVVLDEQGNTLRNTITRPGRERIAQIGPTCALNWPMRRGTSLRIDGWFTIQRVRKRLYGDLPEATAPLIRRAARDGTRTIIPNLSMGMQWRF